MNKSYKFSRYSERVSPHTGFIENTPTRNSTQTIRLINITLLFQMTKIAKGECRDKWKSHFQFGYAEPHPIFVFTKITKGECRDKWKFHFRFDYVEQRPILISIYRIASLSKVIKNL